MNTIETVTVAAPAGTVIGRQSGRVRRFLGIPYAEAPTGARRSAAPVPRGRFTRPYDATRHGPTAQRVPLSATTTVPEPSVPGDDVLNVGVVAPAADDERAPFPVLVWIHGGGFLAGSAASPWYDGRAFARDGVVCVTVGYRLGVDGFAPLDGVPTNLGLRDLLLAVEWVRGNIAAFGGDPADVTVAGQSAGGAAVLALLSSPVADGCFRRAVSLSGGFFEADAAQDFLVRLGQRLGVPPTRAGFTGCGVEELQRGVLDLRGADTLVLGPVIGDDVLPVPVADGLAVRGHDVPLLLGATGDEFDSPRDEAGRAAGTRLTDTLFRAACPRAAAARRDAVAGTWLYSFEWVSPALGGAAHCIDIPYFFDVLDAPGVTEAPVPWQATFAPSRRPARPLAAPAESPSTSSTRACGRHAESTHRTPLLDGQTLPAAALGPHPPAELATVMHADLVDFVRGRTPAWGRAGGRAGDPAREYGGPGTAPAAPAVDTTGVFDPVVRAGEAC
ncbi:carboxylesterase family protein [Streptomyces sp. ALI-76-A]|uniref:carboxylesterase family protein n=1 Tax=Streptomyces sp. ALI-76-A TaxID=3025736 RepID=UPI00256E9BE5|nr:carboxylesterase family protein [Streptomyces sp. ALI-76-A]MDL5199033.1 carboxylesterase family protein [Streptomyces sp. ALI-76-A]